jgi:hypothetical protein
LLDGTPEYCTTMVMNWPARIGRAGVTTSSWSPSRANVAARLLTRTDAVSSTKSRLNRDRSWVARARMVVVPVSRSLSGR